jgi:hypothetical protein
VPEADDPVAVSGHVQPVPLPDECAQATRPMSERQALERVEVLGARRAEHEAVGAGIERRPRKLRFDDDDAAALVRGQPDDGRQAVAPSPSREERAGLASTPPRRGGIAAAIIPRPGREGECRERGERARRLPGARGTC